MENVHQNVMLVWCEFVSTWQNFLHNKYHKETLHKRGENDLGHEFLEGHSFRDIHRASAIGRLIT